jgi:hypothetical protein
VGAAVEGTLGFDTVANDLAFAVLADRSELVDRALKTVECVGVAGGDYLERQVVVVAADFTTGH